MFEFRKFYTHGIGTGGFDGPNAFSAGFVNAANNGLSKSSISPNTAVLGQDIAQATDPGKLLSNREIPFNSFSLAFKDIGTVATSFPIFKTSVAKALITPVFQFQDSTGAETLSFNVTNSGVNNSIYIGRGAGQGITVATRRNIGIGFLALNVATSDFNVAIGWSALSKLLGGQLNVAIGLGALQNITDGIQNTFVGIQAGLNQTATCNGNVGIGGGAMANTSAGAGSQDNVFIGNLSGFFTGAPPFDCARNVCIGGKAFQNSGVMGNDNIVIGFFINSTSLGNIANNNILIGSNIQDTALLSNCTQIGQGMSGGISNVVQLGRADQNCIIGVTAAPVDNGARLQVSGVLTTGGAAPLTLGAGKMDFGKVVTAASVLNAAKYLEMSVDGVLVKVCIN